MGTGVVEDLAARVEEMERDANAARKLLEAAQELGEDRVRAFLAPMLNGNGHRKIETAQIVLDAVDDPLEGHPRGRQAVRMIVHERPGLWTLRDLRAEMKRRGWFTSNKGVDVAVTRMCAKGEARRVGTGRYEFFTPATGERDAA